MRQSTVICFGEVLWDLLPTGKIAGGAPMNVAFQANQLGLSAKMVSRVGADGLGDALLRFLGEKGVSTQFVQTDPQCPTGIVNVTLDSQGSPAYEIVQPSAWDFIASDPTLHDAVAAADALVFGSLACRSDRTQSTLLELLDVAALRVFDVNLRRPFFSQNLLDALLSKADIVKLNDEELDIIAAWHGAVGGEAQQMQFLKKRIRAGYARADQRTAWGGLLGRCGLPHSPRFFGESARHHRQRRRFSGRLPQQDAGGRRQPGVPRLRLRGRGFGGHEAGRYTGHRRGGDSGFHSEKQVRR
jgi:hypothetical protein